MTTFMHKTGTERTKTFLIHRTIDEYTFFAISRHLYRVPGVQKWPIWTKNGLTWQACQSPDVVQKGPKWSQMVNITYFWPFGTFWGSFGPFWTWISIGKFWTQFEHFRMSGSIIYSQLFLSLTRCFKGTSFFEVNGGLKRLFFYSKAQKSLG